MHHPDVTLKAGSDVVQKAALTAATTTTSTAVLMATTRTTRTGVVMVHQACCALAVMGPGRRAGVVEARGTTGGCRLSRGIFPAKTGP